ncbi:long-chain fatty acid--CoA ligase [Mycolicibacterium duvalii]|uniref:Long-chain-fatty-acid--CoA ligase FadD13 n=1 Tax=Mycolicibacterium duvalii TaxID=39688 RepID=A0A7I7K5C6_9MYCO|nr:long-chain-fatty-acid--CoA ligase [Mycolicibacterium duvalii]MCV7367596.1 long-chain-fatty-acid--CoA ligase [Mycolicibacterium duvalii]PEG44096.1 long-chain fatty acid--CoA ligase [Mycolicibacterium duvalii]BBX18814.1 acyl-CoA synthetase [Mycolicibacterium duvalii]
MIDTVADIVRVHARQRPDAPALIVGEEVITFGELDARSNRAAQAFAAAGIGPGDRVAFVDKNGAEFFDVAFGLAKLGAVGVPVNWRLAAPEMRHILVDSGAAAVVVGAEFFAHLEAIEADIDATVIAVGTHARWPDFTDWVAGHPAVDPGVRTAADDLVFLMYTSGTTGLPKGVMLSNANYVCKTGGVAAGPWQLDADAVSLAVMPLFHMAGSGWVFAGLWEGAATVLLRDVVPSEILDAIARHRVTNMLLVPAVIASLLDTPGVANADFSWVRLIVYGASPISDDVLLRGIERFGGIFAQVYGMTETTGSITQLDGAEHQPHLLRSCGRPYPWVEVRIVGTDGAELPVGSVGEVWTRSAQNMLGYWNNPDATAATLTPDGWLRTGDAGYLDADGYLYLHDRVKDMIVSGGENVYPAEVENVLMTHPEVADVAVIGVPDRRWGEAVKAVVVPTAGATLDGAELIAFARARLGGFKLPKSVDLVDALPRTPSGKILKRALREPYWADADRHIG